MAETENTTKNAPNTASETDSTRGKGSGWLSVLTDYGPLLVFLGVYRFYAPDEPEPAGELFAIIRGTGAFMVAALLALGFSKWRLGKVSPMLWFSTALIVGFGGLTIFFRDPVFVQMKPTIIYSLFGIALLIGWKMGKALLKILLEAAFEGLTEEGWLKLSRNWGVFFLALAALNEGLRYFLDFEGWLWAKLWVFLPITFLFTFTQIPMLMKHGLDVGQDEDEPEDGPQASG
ncbi:MAG: inner membrane-spanning protein YciB [Erythrobacter sp.]